MQRGLKMFLVKMLFVVSWFLQLPGVCAFLKSTEEKPLAPSPRRTDSILGADYYCNHKSCQVAICETEETLGELVPHENPPTAETQFPPDLDQNFPTNDEWEALQQWDPMTAIKDITPRWGFCALVLELAKKKAKALCTARCSAEFDCQPGKADKATISRLAVKREKMRSQVEREEKWREHRQDLEAKLREARYKRNVEVNKALQAAAAERPSDDMGKIRSAVIRFAQKIKLRRQVREIEKRHYKVIGPLVKELQQLIKNPACTDRDTSQ